MAPTFAAHTFQDAAEATGNGTALTTAAVDFLIFQVSGTFEGTITPEGTVDGTTYATVPVRNVSTRIVSETITAPGIFQLTMAPYYSASVRMRISAYTSGAITAKGRYA